MKKNRVYAGIDLDALRYNMESMHKNIKEGTKIAAVIKADAYGHGALTVAKTIDCGWAKETDSDPWNQFSGTL